jgi:hypothetical protein
MQILSGNNTVLLPLFKNTFSLPPFNYFAFNA